MYIVKIFHTNIKIPQKEFKFQVLKHEKSDIGWLYKTSQ